MNYAIRVTAPYDDLKAFCDQLVSCCSKVVVYEHNASRVHIHGLLIDCKVSTDTLKNYVKRSLGVSTFPKSDWSFKTLHEGNPVGDDFIIYMSKGDLHPKFVYGYTTEDIELYRSKWVDRSDYVKKKTMTQYKLKYENPKESKIRQNEMMDMIRKRIREKGFTTPRQILEVIRDVVYRECRTIVGRYKIRDFYDVVTADVREEQWLDNMEKLISFREL